MNRFGDYIIKYMADNPSDKVLIYGAGVNGKRCLQYIGRADFFVDKRAKEIKQIENVKCISPEDSYELSGKKLLVISISSVAIRKSIHEMYDRKDDFCLIDFVDTLDFDKYQYNCIERNKLKINIVYKNDGWILGKFANNLKKHLELLGQECYISDKEDPNSDINHFIAFGALPEVFSGTNTKRTTMITHVDTALKLDWIRMQSKNGVVGICMSRDTHSKLQRWGIAPDTICYINPAQDGEIKPRKVNVGITNRCYHHSDYRKRDDLILQVMKHVDIEFFKITIMGAGWDEIVHRLKLLGVEVQYYPDFDREMYMHIMPQFDYWLYYGHDEGAMGYLDAMAAGIKTIVTPQGFHLDTIPGPTHLCSTIDDFIDVFQKISNETKERVNSVSNWTWDNYAFKHLELWRYLTGTITMKDLHSNQSEYEDGIFSLLISNNEI